MILLRCSTVLLSHSAFGATVDETFCLSDDGHSARCILAKYEPPGVGLVSGEDKNKLPLHHGSCGEV